jgi:hypothetical protein
MCHGLFFYYFTRFHPSFHPWYLLKLHNPLLAYEKLTQAKCRSLLCSSYPWSHHISVTMGERSFYIIKFTMLLLTLVSLWVFLFILYFKHIYSLCNTRLLATAATRITTFGTTIYQLLWEKDRSLLYHISVTMGERSFFTWINCSEVAYAS